MVDPQKTMKDPREALLPLSWVVVECKTHCRPRCHCIDGQDGNPNASMSHTCGATSNQPPWCTIRRLRRTQVRLFYPFLGLYWSTRLLVGPDVTASAAKKAIQMQFPATPVVLQAINHPGGPSEASGIVKEGSVTLVLGCTGVQDSPPAIMVLLHRPK